MTVAWLFEDEWTDLVLVALDQTTEQGAIVPSLWRLEVANVLRTGVRRGRCDVDFVDQALARLGRMPIVIDDETDARAWRETLTLSREEGLTIYDSAYLEVAVRRQLPLATADKALAAAAERRNVPVLRR